MRAGGFFARGFRTLGAAGAFARAFFAGMASATAAPEDCSA
jgi:hypothetical protein